MVTVRAEFYGGRYDGLVKVIPQATTFYRFPRETVPIIPPAPAAATLPVDTYKLNGLARPGVHRYEYQIKE